MTHIVQMKNSLQSHIDDNWTEIYRDPNADHYDDLNDAIDGEIPVMNVDLLDVLREDLAIGYHSDALDMVDPDAGVYGVIQRAIFGELRDHAEEYIEEMRGHDAANDAEETAQMQDSE